MPRTIVCISIMLGFCLSACASTSPRKYSLNKAGYATVERVPHTRRPVETAVETPLAPMGPFDRTEALSSLEQYNLYRQEAWELEDRLIKEQAENFISMDVHWAAPDFHFTVLFKSNAKQTLANYTDTPVFRPDEAYDAADYEGQTLEAYGEIVWQRLLEKDAAISSHVTPRYIEIDTGLTREEFAAIKGVQDVHDDPNVKLSFMKPFEPREEIDPRLAPHIRYLSRADRLNGFVLTSLTIGRIVLRKGCFYLDKKTGRDPLVRFHKEVGITLDEKGFIIIKNRLQNVDHAARVGELAGWGDGINEVSKPEILAPLQAACGKHPVVHIGTPNSRYGE